MCRVYTSPHGCLISLHAPLNSQVVLSPWFALQFQASRAANPLVHLLLRSLFKPMLPRIKSHHSDGDKTLLVFTTCPDWTSKQQSAGDGDSSRQEHHMWVLTSFKISVVFMNKLFLVCCTSPVNFQSAEMVVFDGFNEALWLPFGKRWFINLFTLSWWKLLSEHQVFIVFFPCLERCHAGG